MKNSFRSSGRALPRIVFCLVLSLLLSPAFAPSAALAGQTIIIDSPVDPGYDVVGNSPNANGWWDWPLGGNLLNPNNNTVIINSNVGGSIFGGVDVKSGSDAATATGNSVTINSGGTVTGHVYGGYAESTSGDATASGNKVFIGGNAKVDGNIYGGDVESTSGDATASGNKVFIGGNAEVGGNIYGGFASSNTGSNTATNNTVTISGSPIFSVATELWGGQAVENGSYVHTKAFTGNTLNLWNYNSQGPVALVRNFEYLNFVFPTTQSGAVLEATSVVLGDGAGKGSTITASTIGGTAPLQPESQVTLIDASAIGGGGIIGDLASTQATGKHGATLSYLWNLENTGTMLTANLNSVQAAPEAKVLSEGYIAGLTLINQGADLIAGKGIMNALSAAGPRGASGFGSFAAISGGWSRYNTGSHVDVSGLSLITGASWGTDLAPGRLTVGAFFEFGTGSYDTHNSFRNVNAKGDGDTYHLGGGVLGRMDFANTGVGNFYAEASLRAGAVHNDYNTSALRDAMGRKATKYDASSAYYGLHAGAGYLWKLSQQASLDLYGKYFWTRQQGDKVTLSTGDPVKFDDTDSQRLRLGGRFAYAVSETLAPYAGVAWEQEFDGKQRATTYGYAIDTPSLRGSTGIAEFGVALKPSKTLPLSLDLGLQGYVGRREGATGSLRVRYEF